QSEYAVTFEPKRKKIEIITSEPQTTLQIQGGQPRDLVTDEQGRIKLDLAFPPINDQGELRTYTLIGTKKTEDREWYPGEFVIGWDEGKAKYAFEMREILTTPINLMQLDFVHEQNEWKIKPKVA